MPSNPLRTILPAMLLLAACALPAMADAAVDAFVARINAAVGAVAPGDAAGAGKACATLVGQVFDIDAMAPSASAGAWQRMNGRQRNDYRKALARRAAADCARRADDVQTVQLVGVRDGDGGDRFVAVRSGSRTLVWQVRGSGRLLAVDVSVNGRSLVNAARRDAEVVLKSTGGDLQALIGSVGN